MNKKPRVLISTDIGGRDPDDYQSLVHYLVYCDIVKTEGIISSPPYEGRKKHILETLHAYETDYPRLVLHGDYPTVEELIDVTYQGATETLAPRHGRSTDGSRCIIEAANKDDERPLYLLVWGSMTDLAQALFDQPQIENRLRVYSIGSWNTQQDPQSRDYIFQNHPALWWIENNTTFRGMYIGGRQTDDLANDSFVSLHVKDHGALGTLFCKKKSVIKMGDTPSVLYIISSTQGHVGNPENPQGPSWGGSFIKSTGRAHYWTDNPDPRLIEHGKPGAKTVSMWRQAYLRDWQKRMDRLL